MTIKLGKTARLVRESVGISQRAMADLLGVSDVHLCNVENNKASPSQALIDRYRDLWGIDLYVFAWCLNGDVNKLPPAVRRPAQALVTAWRAEIAKKLDRFKDESQCSTCDK